MEPRPTIGAAARSKRSTGQRIFPQAHLYFSECGDVAENSRSRLGCRAFGLFCQLANGLIDLEVPGIELVLFRQLQSSCKKDLSALGLAELGQTSAQLVIVVYRHAGRHRIPLLLDRCAPALECYPIAYQRLQ